MTGPELLDFLASRRSTRNFTDAPVSRAVVERCLTAAISAPSATNRQPWRFYVLSGDAHKCITGLVRARVEEMRAIIARGHHADAIGSYSDFFHEPLEAAAVVIVPAYRRYDDLIASLVRSGGEDPTHFDTSSAMQSELCATSAACMLLLAQATAEGLGACWMAGPMVAQREIESELGIAPPFRMLGAIALGWPAEHPVAQPRRSLDAVVRWVE